MNRTCDEIPDMFALAAVLCIASSPEPATTHLAIFSSWTEPYRPQKTHTFAVMMRRKPGQPVERATISWLPSTMKVRGLAVRPESGTNWSLTETLDWAARGGMCVSVWGPYPVEDCLFDSFQQQIVKLQSGCIAYKSLDALRPNRNAMNCVHAVQGVQTSQLKPIGPFGYGETATRETLGHFAPCIRNWCADLTILPAMGVDPKRVIPRSPDHFPTRLQQFDSFTR